MAAYPHRAGNIIKQGSIIQKNCGVKYTKIVPLDIGKCPYVILVSKDIHSHPPPPPYPVISRDTTYISYTQSEAKYYQYGVKRFFDSTQTADWQVIADFSVARGTQVQEFTINNLFGQSSLSATVYSTVVVDTVISTTSIPTPSGSI